MRSILVKINYGFNFLKSHIYCFGGQKLKILAITVKIRWDIEMFLAYYRSNENLNLKIFYYATLHP